MGDAATSLAKARDFLLENRDQYVRAYEGFRWPQLTEFNFALDWIDAIARERDREALRIVDGKGRVESFSYQSLSCESSRLANYLRAKGVRRGDVVLLMLGNVSPLWIAMLAAMKLGAVVIPATPLLSTNDLADRVSRGRARFVIAASEFADRFNGLEGFAGISVGGAVAGWAAIEEAAAYSSEFAPDGPTNAKDPLLLYFTSGTTALPKLVRHSHVSYPVGHLSTMFWIGLKPGDLHLNISSPGWAKHAWSSVFAPWLAEATILVLKQDRFDARQTLDVIEREGVTTFCAPPTVWRMVVQEDLSRWQPKLREAVGAGEPLNAEIIGVVREAWGVTIRDGFGQTETSALIGNSPGQTVEAGKVGRPLPGFVVRLRDGEGIEADEGEICVELGDDRPVGIMQGYQTDEGLRPVEGAFYRTGDLAQRGPDGRFTYVGRADDVFKASDYRISPFELESVLIEHSAVLEAAIVPSPDPTRLAVPKAFVTLAPGHEPTPETARSILEHARRSLGPFKRVRRIEFGELPKTISGKIRRVELRRLEAERRAADARGPFEWLEEEVVVKFPA
jgi:acetyl-CoA synthetase